jgi:YD repeat-containing protein
VTDTNVPSQSATTGAVVSVGQPPALVAPPDLTPTQLPNGTTTTSFTFADASGGAPPYSYVMIVQSSTGAVTLDTYVGKSANILGLTDGVTAQVVVQAVDSLGQTADATYVVGVGVVPVFSENAIWNLIGGTDLRTIGSGVRTGVGLLVVGGITFQVVQAVGAPSGYRLNIDSNGVNLLMTGTVGESAGVYFNPNLLVNFTTGEHILVNMLFSTQAVMPTNSVIAVTFGDGTDYSAGSGYGVSLNWDANGARVARRLTGGTTTTYTLATGQTNSNKTYASQVLLVAGRIPYITLSESTSFIGGPRLGLTNPMRGTQTGTPGAQSTSAGATFSPPISQMRIQLAVASANCNATLLAYEVRRLTRSM